MRPHVNDEGALLRKGLVTERAAERFLALVHRGDVPVDVALVPEPDATVRTAEGLLPRVDPHVRLQVTFLAEAPLADRADEWFLVLMNDHVLPEVPLVSKPLVADVTFKRPTMSQHVLLQLQVAGKTSAADGAPRLFGFPLASV